MMKAKKVIIEWSYPRTYDNVFYLFLAIVECNLSAPPKGIR